MFSLLYGLWKYLFSKAEFHALILGIDKAGKTTLLEKLKTLYSEIEGLPPDRIVPTVGLNIGRAEAYKSKLIFWDLGGQILVILIHPRTEKYTETVSSLKVENISYSECLVKLGLRTIWEKYFEEAHSVIYVVDSACRSRFDDAKSALAKVLRHEDLQGAPVLIFANKQDLPESVPAEEITNYFDLKELNDHPHLFQSISAYDGSGIRDGISWLVDAMRKSKRTEMLRQRSDVVTAT